MAENLCFKMGGGTQKWDLLWENPNPSSTMGATNVPVDFSKYDKVFVLMKPHMGYAARDYRLIEICQGDLQIMCAQVRDTWIGYRKTTVTATQITFTATAGYVYHNGGGASGTAYCIPVAVYGVKKVKLGE